MSATEIFTHEDIATIVEIADMSQQWQDTIPIEILNTKFTNAQKIIDILDAMEPADRSAIWIRWYGRPEGSVGIGYAPVLAPQEIY